MFKKQKHAKLVLRCVQRANVYAQSIQAIERKQQRAINGQLTKSLGCPAPVCGQKLGRPANKSTPTCVARTWGPKSEVFWYLNRLIGSPSKTYTNLERGGSICWVLVKCTYNSCLATIGNLLVEWGAWKKIDNRWIFLAAMGRAALEL